MAHRCTFHARLQDQGVATHCKLATFDPDLSFAGSDDEPAPELDVVFNANTDIRHKIVMPSSRLDDAFKELDPTAEKITFAIQSEEPYFRMSADGVTGSTEVGPLR